MNSLTITLEGKKKFYFTFGQKHIHRIDNFTFDKDVVVEIEAENVNKAREIMCEHFSDKWAFVYDHKPEMKFFPRGIKKL